MPLLVALLRRRLWLRRVPLFHGRGKARVALDYAGAWRDIGFSNRRLRPLLCGRLASGGGAGPSDPDGKGGILREFSSPLQPFRPGVSFFRNGDCLQEGRERPSPRDKSTGRRKCGVGQYSLLSSTVGWLLPSFWERGPLRMARRWIFAVLYRDRTACVA